MFYCSKCGKGTECLYEGYCEDCHKERQSELLLHNARFERLSNKAGDIMKLIRYVDYMLVILIGYTGIIGSAGACDFDNITISQCLIQSGVSFLLCYILYRWGFTKLSRIIRWRKKCRQAQRIFNHGKV